MSYIASSDQKPVSALRRGTGFTLPELVAVILITSIIAAVVAPRFATRAEFDVYGVTERTRQALRFAQKSAIAKRRTACVTIATNALSITFSSSYGGACDLNLIDPQTGSAFSYAAVSGITLGAASFSFDPAGKPSFSSNQTIAVSGGSLSNSIVVEAETGYVR